MATDDHAQGQAGDESDPDELIQVTLPNCVLWCETKPEFMGLVYTKTQHKADREGKIWARFSADYWPQDSKDAIAVHLGEAEVHLSSGRSIPSPPTMAVKGEDAETSIAKQAEKMLRALTGDGEIR